MARIFQTGFELSLPEISTAYPLPDGCSSSYYLSPKPVSVLDTVVKRTGASSLKLQRNGTNNPQALIGIAYPNRSTAGIYIRYYMRFSAMPTSYALLSEIFLRDSQLTGALSMTPLRLDSNGDLYLNSGANTTSKYTVTTDVWYMVEIYYSNGGTTSETLSFRVDGIDLGSISITSASGYLFTEFSLVIQNDTSSMIVYVDDLAVNDSTSSQNNSWCGPGNVVLLKPTYDSTNTSTLWLGANGGTTNLYDAVNNVPPIGDATADDTKRIECVDKTGVNMFSVGLETYASKGITSFSFITAMQGWVCHGEEASTGTKTGNMRAYITDSSYALLSPYDFGNNVGAIDTYPTNWAWGSVVCTRLPSTTGDTTNGFVMIEKTDTGTRSATVCAMMAYVDYTVKSDPGYRPPAQLIAPLLAM